MPGPGVEDHRLSGPVDGRVTLDGDYFSLLLPVRGSLPQDLDDWYGPAKDKKCPDLLRLDAVGFALDFHPEDLVLAEREGSWFSHRDHPGARA